MKVVFGGVRGSYPVAQSGFMEFGGETTALLVESGAGGRLLLDAGTGLRLLGKRLEQGGTRHLRILLTHYHLDHLVGLVSLPALYAEGWTIEMIGPGDVEANVFALLTSPFWPFDRDAYPADFLFTTLPEGGSDALHFDGLSVRWCPLHHHAGATAYRIDEAATGASVLFATDVEWQASSETEKRQLLDLCAGPGPLDLLVFDGHFTPENYAERTEWGHSSWADAVEVARSVRARRLLITHHAPGNDDSTLAKIESEVINQMPGAALARGGMEVELG